MVPFLFMTTVLLVAVVAVLIMTQVLELKQLGSAIWRVLGFLWVVIAICVLLRLLLLPMLLCVLVALKTAVLSALVIVVLAIVLLGILRVALLKGINEAKRHGTKEE